MTFYLILSQGIHTVMHLNVSLAISYVFKILLRDILPIFTLADALKLIGYAFISEFSHVQQFYGPYL